MVWRIVEVKDNVLIGQIIIIMINKSKEWLKHGRPINWEKKKHKRRHMKNLVLSKHKNG